MNEIKGDRMHGIDDADVDGEFITSSAPCFESLYQLSELWVFGYGSILWNTGFDYDSRVVGYLKGYTRKFWQGNTTHRGTPECPGRVATLVHQGKGRVWGVAYRVRGPEMVRGALEHLGVRECSLGGYTCRFIRFTPRTSERSKSVEALTFLALPCSSLYLGPAPLDVVAEQVVRGHGPSGSNVEYVIRLAQFIRNNIPEDVDEHLFNLERKVLKRLGECDLWRDQLEPSTISAKTKLKTIEGLEESTDEEPDSINSEDLVNTDELNSPSSFVDIDTSVTVVNSCSNEEYVSDTDSTLRSMVSPEYVDLDNCLYDCDGNDLYVKRTLSSLRKISFDGCVRRQWPTSREVDCAKAVYRRMSYPAGPERGYSPAGVLTSVDNTDSCPPVGGVTHGYEDDLIIGHHSTVRRFNSHCAAHTSSRHMYNG